MRKFFKEFLDFIRKGNVLDLAIAIIIGNAFNKIVSSLVNDIIMPLVGLIGKKNIQEAKLVLVEPVTDESGNIIRNAVTLNYGSFIQYIIDFLIIALTVFIILKVIKAIERRAERLKNKIKKNDSNLVEETVEPKPTTEEILLEIRDLLKNNKNS